LIAKAHAADRKQNGESVSSERISVTSLQTSPGSSIQRSAIRRWIFLRVESESLARGVRERLPCLGSSAVIWFHYPSARPQSISQYCSSSWTSSSAHGSAGGDVSGDARLGEY